MGGVTDDGQISGLNHQLDQGSLNWPERETERNPGKGGASVAKGARASNAADVQEGGGLKPHEGL